MAEYVPLDKYEQDIEGFTNGIADLEGMIERLNDRIGTVEERLNDLRTVQVEDRMGEMIRDINKHLRKGEI